jgi:hypothetical protein
MDCLQSTKFALSHWPHKTRSSSTQFSVIFIPIPPQIKSNTVMLAQNTQKVGGTPQRILSLRPFDF